MSEGRFDSATGIAARHWVVTPRSSESMHHWAWYQAYTNQGLATLLGDSGFDAATVEFYPNLVDTEEPPRLQFVTATRR